MSVNVTSYRDWYELAHAAGLDAGNRAMRAGGRVRWSRADYNAAARETNRLLDSWRRETARAVVSGATLAVELLGADEGAKA